MDTETVQLIRRADGLLLDTNILLLRAIGRTDPDFIVRFKRTADRFVLEDLDLLIQIERLAKCLTTTPHILAEASNLIGQLPEALSYAVRARLLTDIQVVDERWREARHASTDAVAWAKFGAADWALIDQSRLGQLVLTDDFPLSSFIGYLGLVCINFNHVRILNG